MQKQSNLIGEIKPFGNQISNFAAQYRHKLALAIKKSL
jgi:hypothetical protein